MSAPYNLFDVESMVLNFMKEREQGIHTLHRMFFQTTDSLSLAAFKTELMDELKTGCVTFINKNDPNGDLNSYLFYIVNAFCRKKAQPRVRKQNICAQAVYF